MKIYLHYNNGNHRGPGMVVKNLCKGLSKLDDVEVVQTPGKADLIGCLQHPGFLLDKIPATALMGPNLFVLPHEEPKICERFQNFVVPSQWVLDLYSTNRQLNGKNIRKWSVGIDTDEWFPFANKEKDLDCFVYFKNRPISDLNLVHSFLEKQNLKFAILEYGTYEEEELKELCKRSKFAILVTGTESQGIAYMNMLSADVPCFVFDKTSWTYERDPSISASATSVPYFNKDCGVITASSLSDEATIGPLFKDFREKVEQSFYNPRKYIVDFHNLQISAAHYVDRLKRSSF